MDAITRSAVLGVVGVAFASGWAMAQVCIENICFVDRGASGEITLGPLFGSVSVIDYDDDDFPDLIIRTNFDSLARLFRNIPDPVRAGERTFEEVTGSTSLAQYSGIAATPPGALVADYDNDGWPDVYLSGRRTIDTESGRLYRNTGSGDFVDVTAAAGVVAVGDDQESASWADFDLDGFVDLMIASRAVSVHPMRLLRNRGDGTFEDASDRLPAIGGWPRMYAHTWTDFDNDGYSDVFCIPNTGPVQLRNVADGFGGRRFEDVAAIRGFDYLGPAPMGISAGDYDNDGDFDIGLSNGLIGVYYENLGGVMARRELMTSIFAWGTLWLDVNNDGRLDHYQAGSAGQMRNFNKLFLNRGGGVFEDISPVLNDLFLNSQHAAQVDFNNDGRQDIITINPHNTPMFVSVSENVSETGNHWFRVRLRGDGVRVNRDAIGAIVRVMAGGVTQSREITSGSSTNSSEDVRAHFGVGSATAVERIEVRWPRRGTLASRTEVYEGPFGVDRAIELSPRCVGDWNGDGSVTSQDFFEFVVAFLSGDERADADGSGTIGSADFFVFVSAFFGGCGS